MQFSVQKKTNVIQLTLECECSKYRGAGVGSLGRT